MRGVIGFAAGVVAGAAGVIYLASESGRELRERLLGEAQPEVRAALDEWEPTLREVARAARQGARELEAAAISFRRFVGDLADEASASRAEGVAKDVGGGANDVGGGAEDEETAAHDRADTADDAAGAAQDLAAQAADAAEDAKPS